MGGPAAGTTPAQDYSYEGELSDFGKTFCYATRGTGGMRPNNHVGRQAPTEVFGGHVNIGR